MITHAPKLNDPGFELFHPIEHAYISDLLGLPRPAGTEEIELNADYSKEADKHPTVIYPERGIHAWENEIDDACSNAVARLVLSNIQGRLPQWGTVNAQGEVVLARKRGAVRRQAVSLMPQYLFTINWGDSGPGFSWPEAYYATYVPFYDVYVVTLSQDSPDCYGYADLAMGHFAPAEPVIDGARRVITGQWRTQFGHDRELRWAYLFGTGLVDE